MGVFTMPSVTSPRIAYPTLAEHIESRRQDGMTFGEMARHIGTKEETVIGWTNGVAPGHRLLQAIEKALDYSFTARRFAEAMADATFPPPDAPPDIAAITTHEALITYLNGVRKIVTLPALADFFRWKVTNLSNVFVHPEYAREREQLADMLRRISQLPDHLSGATLSRCTPRAVIGRLLRDARQARGEPVEQYAQRVGIAPSMLRVIEASGTGRQPQSRVAVHAQAITHRSEFFKKPEDFDRILAFLGAERLALGDRLATPVAAVPAPHEEAPPAVEATAPSRAVAAASSSGTSRRALHDRLQAFVGRVTMKRAATLLGIPRSTIHGVLRHPQRAKRPTVARIVAALDAYESASAPREPQTPVAGVVPSVEHRLAELEDRVRQLTAGGGHASSSADGGEYVSPLSRERFQSLDQPVSAERLATVRARVQQLCEDLGELASITSSEHRWTIQRALGAIVDELFVTLEGFLREYPSGALVTLEGQRKFHADQRARIASGASRPSSPTQGDE